MTFNHEKGRGKKRIPPGQFSTPLKVAQALAKLASLEIDFKNKIIFEPCVGTGNLLIPLIDKGAVLIGSDIDQEALEICKQRILKLCQNLVIIALIVLLVIVVTLIVVLLVIA